MNKKIAWLLFILHPTAFILSAEAGVALPEQTRGGVTARLTVHVADAGPQPGAALVLLTLQVTGGPLLQVEPATLADPMNAWEADRNEWSRLTDGRVTWTQSMRLKQVKPGAAALPDVKVRFRDGPSAAWEEAEWVDLLKTARDAPPPELSPPAAAGTSWLPWAGLAASVLTLAAMVWGLRRRRRLRPKNVAAGPMGGGRTPPPGVQRLDGSLFGGVSHGAVRCRPPLPRGAVRPARDAADHGRVLGNGRGDGPAGGGATGVAARLPRTLRPGQVRPRRRLAGGGAGDGGPGRSVGGTDGRHGNCTWVFMKQIFAL